MSDSLKVALAQLNPVVGDISANMAKLITAWREAARQGVDLIVTGELFLTGYPPQDFVLKPRIHKVLRESVEALVRETASGPAILLGTPWLDEGKLYNAALLIDGGKIVGQSFKHELPNYGPFDEKRVYDAGGLPQALVWRDNRLGVMLCEDMWKPDVSRHLAAQNIDILLVLNGSPYETGKQRFRHVLAQERVVETGAPLVYVNQVGGQDELLFEGASFAFDAKGKLAFQAPFWAEATPVVELFKDGGRWTVKTGNIAAIPETEAATYTGLVTGLRDYVGKNGFERVVIGLSGGIDSALVAALAVDALGADKVHCVMMPSPYTSQDSLDHAQEVAKKLGCRLDTIKIEEAMHIFDVLLAEQFMGCAPDVTEENIQSRIRGVLLMAISNKSSAMVLATGNKSELATGYATLYGDMCGGFAPLKDIYKTEVYKLVRWRNAHKPEGAKGPDGAVISDGILAKPPTAELKPDQRDQDTLPPYDVLDDILKGLIEQDLGVAETTMMGHNPATVRKVYTMLDRAEYKRRQGPPGPKVTRRHLTLDRRYPITNAYFKRWSSQQTD